MADDFATLNAKVLRFEQSLGKAGLRSITEAVALEAKKDYLSAAEGDLSNRDFSNWHRGRPFQLGARYDLTSDSSASVGPTPRTQGPWKVLTYGRHADDRGGPTRQRRGKSRRGPSRIGATRGKGTASKAARMVEERTPRRVSREVSKRLTAAFRAGGAIVR